MNRVKLVVGVAAAAALFIALTAYGLSMWRIPRAAAAVPGDVDGDGHVNLTDLTLIAKAWHSHPGDPNWDPRCDLNGDNWVSLADLCTVGVNYGKY